MEKKVFGKTYDCNGLVINFSYTTFTNNEDVNIKEKGMLLDNIFNDFYSSDIVDIVQVVRTIFKEYEEEIMNIYVSFDNKNIYASFCKTKLLSYSETVEIDNSEKIIFKYNERKDLDFNVKRSSNSFKVFNTADLVEAFNQFMLTIDSLNNVSVINLDMKDELLCKVYKLFFDEDPDFSKKDTNVKIQTMITVLAQFNICIDYPMCVYSNGKMPINYILSAKIRSLRALGKVDVSKLTMIQLNEEVKNEVKEIGKIVRDSNIDMVTLSKIVHAGNYNLSDKSDTDYILKSTKCVNEEVEQGIKIVKRIKRSLEEK